MSNYISYQDFLKSDKSKNLLKKRYKKEKVFYIFGVSTIIISSLLLLILMSTIVTKSFDAFFTTKIKLNIKFDQYISNYDDYDAINYRNLIKNSLKETFPDVKKRKDKKSLYKILSKSAKYDIKEYVLLNQNLQKKEINIWLTASSAIDQYIKNNDITLSNKEIKWINILQDNKNIQRQFNWKFFSNGDSSEAELAGIGSSFLGSIYTILIFLIISFPLGVLTALYLEEFAPKNKITDLIEININNLAAVPSIIFGLLGLAIYIGFLNFPRSSALAGGFTLALMVMPTIVISTRNSIKSIPLSIKHAALGLGASPTQVALHHTIPLAMPGIMTGTILAVARAIGETAPLLMIGMVAFIVDKPSSITDPTTVMPVQIYLWSNNPEIGFIEKTSAAILILLIFLIIINSMAIILRNKFYKKW